MQLFSIAYFLFIFVTLVCYYCVPVKLQWVCLLLANLFFYASTGVANLCFIAFTAGSTFVCARFMDNLSVSLKTQKKTCSKEAFKTLKVRTKQKQKTFLVFALVLNIGILAGLKYWNAVIAGLESVFNLSLAFLHFGGNKTLLLPLGISFYTFQALGYLIDIYYGKYGAEKNFFRYFLFTSFFPQLIQGPINRYDKLGKQFAAFHSFKFENFKRGLLLFLFGALKKYCVADLTVTYIAQVFDGPYNNLPGSFIVLGILMYSIYQYADFSGGIDMVMGVSKLFDIDMQPNFRQPYFSVSLADFWRRWHISLGLWMKDYVFYPFILSKPLSRLGSVCSKKLGPYLARTIPAGLANILIFLLVGIWHGPELHFVLWGLYNGLVIAVSDLLKPVFDKVSTRLKIQADSAAWKVWRIVRTFVVVNIGWYFDRIYDVRKSFRYLRNTFCNFRLHDILTRQTLKDVFRLGNAESKLTLVAAGCMIIFIVSVLKEKNCDVYASLQRKNIAVRWGAYYLLAILVILSLTFAPGTQGFMYAYY